MRSSQIEPRQGVFTLGQRVFRLAGGHLNEERPHAAVLPMPLRGLRCCVSYRCRARSTALSFTRTRARARLPGSSAKVEKQPLSFSRQVHLRVARPPPEHRATMFVNPPFEGPRFHRKPRPHHL